MKFIFSIAIVLLLSVSANSQEAVKNLNPENKKNMVEIIYMHSSHRCEMDLEIEAQTKNIVDLYFKDQSEGGKLELNIYDTDEEANEKYVDLYEPEAQTLLIMIYDKKGKVIKQDYSDFAFANIIDIGKFIDEFKKITEKALNSISK